MLQYVIRRVSVLTATCLLVACASKSITTAQPHIVEASILESRLQLLLADEVLPAQYPALLTSHSHHFFEILRYLSLNAKQPTVDKLPLMLQYFIAASRIHFQPQQLAELPLSDYESYILTLAPIKLLKQNLRAEQQLKLSVKFAHKEGAITQINWKNQTSQIELYFQRKNEQWAVEIEPFLYLLDKLVVDIIDQNASEIVGLDWMLMGYVFNHHSIPEKLQVISEDVDEITSLVNSQKYIDAYQYYLMLWQMMRQPVDSTKTHHEQLQQWHDYGLTLTYLGNREAANSYFYRVLAEDETFVPAYHSLAIDRLVHGDFVQANSYLTLVQHLEPDNLFTDRVKGYMSLYQGDYAAAATYFDAYLLKQPDDAYVALWRYLAQRQQGYDQRLSSAQLQAFIENNRTLKWPDAIFDYILENLNENGLFFLAQDRDPAKFREQLCEAYFYLGFLSLVEGDSLTAENYFKATVSTEVYGFLEYDLADYMLQHWELFK